MLRFPPEAVGFTNSDPAYGDTSDVSLLFRRMAALRIDRDELAGDEPLLFRELQGFCSLCRSKGQCVRGLIGGLDDDPGWQDWRDYCPNAATLSVLATLRDCVRASR